MEMRPVASSNVTAVGYDAATETLRIDFNSGTYDYSNVPEDVYEGLVTAASVGRFIAQNIRGNYPSTKV